VDKNPLFVQLPSKLYWQLNKIFCRNMTLVTLSHKKYLHIQCITGLLQPFTAADQMFNQSAGLALRHPDQEFHLQVCAKNNKCLPSS